LDRNGVPDKKSGKVESKFTKFGSTYGNGKEIMLDDDDRLFVFIYLNASSYIKNISVEPFQRNIKLGRQV